MNYADLMQQLQAHQAQFANPGGMRIDDEGRRLLPGDIGYDQAPNPLGEMNTFSNGLTGNRGVSYTYDPSTDSFFVAQGDSTSGIQRFNVGQGGTTDLGFEHIDRKGKSNRQLITMAAIAAGGALGAYGAGLMGTVGTAGGTAAAGTAAAGATTGAASTAGTTGMFGSALTGLAGTGGTSMYGSLINAGVGLVANEIAARRNEGIARDQANAQRNAALEAADMSRFRPVNVSTGLGSAMFQTDANGNVTGASSYLDPRLTQLQGSALGQAQSVFGQPIDVNTLGNQFYNNYLQTARPQQNQMFSSLQDRLNGQGLLGLQTNSGMGPGENPFYTSFVRGTQMADADAWRQSFASADQLASNEQARGVTALNSALGIDKIGTGLIDMGGVLGGRGSSAAAQGASNLFAAGQVGANAQAGAASAHNNATNAAIQAAINRIFLNTQQGNQPQGNTAARQSMGDMYGNVGW